MTQEIHEMLPNNSFCAKSFFYKDKPLGLFYITHNNGVDKTTFDDFRQVMVRFDHHIPRVS